MFLTLNHICPYICVFLLFENLFLSSSTASRQISIDSHLSRPLDCFFSADFNTSSIHQGFLEFVSIASRQILNPLKKFQSSRQILDSSSIYQGIFVVDKFSTEPQQIHLLRISSRQILDRFSIDLDQLIRVFYKQIQRDFRYDFLQSLSIEKLDFLSQTLFSQSFIFLA